MSGKILFVCVENAGRSRMAEAFGRQAGIDCESAGTVPAESVNPMVVSAMKEIGISLGKERPRMLTDDMVKNASRIITMGCSVEEACPAILYREMMTNNVERINMEFGSEVCEGKIVMGKAVDAILKATDSKSVAPVAREFKSPPRRLSYN